LIKLFGGGNTQEIMELALEKTKYQAGETVRGKLVMSTDKDIKARSFRFIAEGKEKTKVTVSEYSSSSNSSSNVTYTASNLLFSTNLEQFLSQSSKPSIITNTGNGILLHKGSSEIPFEFPLPNNVLSSYRGINASIAYEVKATIDKKLYSDTNASVSFDVISITKENNNYPTNSKFYSSNKSSKGLYINLVIPKNVYKAGDIIEGTIFIGKPKPNSTTIPQKTTTTIRSIKIKLIATEYATASKRVDTSVIQSIDNEISNWKENEETPFEIKIPEEVDKSYRSKLSELYWEIKANLDIPMDKDLNAIARIEIR
jgi:hypothetical protein